MTPKHALHSRLLRQLCNPELYRAICGLKGAAFDGRVALTLQVRVAEQILAAVSRQVLQPVRHVVLGQAHDDVKPFVRRSVS
jgi:hypothetical protein